MTTSYKPPMTTSYKLLMTTSYKTTSYKPLIILNINFSNIFSTYSTCTVGHNYKRDSSSRYNKRRVLHSLSSIMIMQPHYHGHQCAGNQLDHSVLLDVQQSSLCIPSL